VTRYLRIAAPAAVLLAAMVGLYAALAIGGGAEAGLLDPGPVVRYGLPIAKLLVNLGAAAAIGALVLACFALKPGAREFDAAVDVAAAGAGLWTVASAAVALLNFMLLYNLPLSFDEQFGEQLAVFLTQIELGQAWLLTTLLAAVVTVLCLALRAPALIAGVAVLAAASLIPMAQQGHSAGATGHNEAITALGLHLLFAAVWLGGLVTIVLLHKQLDKGRLAVVLARYSTVALICFIVVAISGYASAELRVGAAGQLLTPYGALVIIKASVLIVLGVFGFLQRRWAIRKLDRGGSKGWFWGLVVTEIAFMGIASGVAAALARTATPVPEEPALSTPANILTEGTDLPPEPTFIRFFTEWSVDLLWLLVCAFGIFFYLAAVVRLHRRGDRWPVLRTVLWVLGMISLFYVTSGGVQVYGVFLFSAHMLGHMVLSMFIPMLLVPAAPITLALRAIRKRQDGSRGPREWLMLLVHSGYGRFIVHPLVAAVIFAVSLMVFYYTPLFRWAVSDHLGHQWMIVHFLLSGYLFVSSLIGIDPVPYRAPYPMRLITLLLVMAFHAFFGLYLLEGSNLLLADWYGATGRPWLTDALADQKTGGGIAWGIGEVPTVLLAIITAVSWSRSDEKETKRRDRQADRTDEAELKAYNAMLTKMGRGGPRPQ